MTKTIKHPTKLEKNWAKKMSIATDNVWQIEHSNSVLVRTHTPDKCGSDEACVLHNMTDHSMRAFPQLWRGDRGIMERICTHGIGHPDPDQIPFWKQTKPKDWHWEMVHGCDGCCRPDSKTYKDNYGE
jgi:hypothetical protein